MRFTIKGHKLTVKGELPNGFFYLEGPRGGSAHFAKPLGNGNYVFVPAKPGSGPYTDMHGLLITVTRDELIA